MLLAAGQSTSRNRQMVATFLGAISGKESVNRFFSPAAEIEGFAQGFDEGLILTDGFPWAIEKLGYRFAFTFDQFNHDIQRLDARNITGQAGADAEHQIDVLVRSGVTAPAPYPDPSYPRTPVF